MSTPLSITIITPNLNGGKHLKACIESVKSQSYESITHVVIDGGSSDDSIQILKDSNTQYEVVKGLNNYEAIHYGFKKYSSDVQAWLNSDDVYHQGAIQTVMEVFTLFSDISWVTGTPSTSNEHGVIRVWESSPYPVISKYTSCLSSKIFIQQESTFWRSALYEKVGGVSNEYRYANDYALWLRFFEHQKLYAIPQVLASFRMHSLNQLSVQHRDEYLIEVIHMLAEKNKLSVFYYKVLMAIDFVLIRTPIIRKFYSWLRIRQHYLGFSPRLYFDSNNQLVIE